MPSLTRNFDIDFFLAAARSKRKPILFRKKQVIFSQGSRSDAIFYIEDGNVKLTVTSGQGKEAIIGVLGPGDIFGESCIASDRLVRFHTATAFTDVRVVKIARTAVMSTLPEQCGAFYALISLLLRLHFRVQQDFANALLESSEKRLARALFAIARLNENKTPSFPTISQQDWADMIGITRQRVNVLLRRFRKSRFIDDALGLKVNPSLLTVLAEQPGREAEA